jgi:hypothetical protein
MSEPLPSDGKAAAEGLGSLSAQTFELSSIAPPVRHFWTRGFAERLTIDASGIRVEYAHSRAQTIQWNDSDLEFYTVDYRVPTARNDRWSTPAQARRTPFSFFPGPFGSPSSAWPVWVTEAAYNAIYQAGLAARLHAGLGSGRSFANDAVVTVFRRKPFRLWAVRELNPNALP